MRILPLAVAALWAILPTVPALADQPPAPIGRYTAAEGPDLASELVIAADGRFSYMLSAGALDERATGRWVADGVAIRLTTEPKPAAPSFRPGPVGRTDEAPIKLLVTWPNGRGIPGIDFLIGFDDGGPVEGYTQVDGWTSSTDERRQPRWIELVEPIHGIASPRFPIAPTGGNALTFILNPGDFGVVDFDQALVEITADGLRLHRGNAALRYVRAKD